MPSSWEASRAFCDLHDDGKGFVQRDRALRDPIRQGRAVDQFQQKRLCVVAFCASLVATAAPERLSRSLRNDDGGFAAEAHSLELLRHQ